MCVSFCKFEVVGFFLFKENFKNGGFDCGKPILIIFLGFSLELVKILGWFDKKIPIFNLGFIEKNPNFKSQ